MSVTWVLVANASSACLYENGGPGKGLRKVREFDHAASRAKRAQLVSDTVGHGRCGAVRGIGYERALDPRRHEAERFAGELVGELESARRTRRFDRLVLTASPAFMGRLRRQLPVPLARSLVLSVEKDYTKAEPRRLQRTLERDLCL